jgi:hypothetical protein
VIPWIGDQNFFYSPECLKKVPGTKLRSKKHIWIGILGVDSYSVRQLYYNCLKKIPPNNAMATPQKNSKIHQKNLSFAIEFLEIF